MRGFLAVVLLGCGEGPMPGESTGSGVESTSDAASSSASTAVGTATSVGTSSPESAGAGSAPRPDFPMPVSYGDVQDIFDMHCVAGCHEFSGTYPSLELGGYARNELVFVASNGSPLSYVVPDNHDTSYLWHKVSGSQGSVGGMGARMPSGDVPSLAPEEIDLIADWIDDGAPP